ncbi:hypothetical protein CS369_12705 [Candidatus Symbiopectobacterium sp. 'North America']|nr:hypothetical protein [Candidatus Symbiopectobacterium sp. 'North America']
MGCTLADINNVERKSAARRAAGRGIERCTRTEKWPGYTKGSACTDQNLQSRSHFTLNRGGLWYFF